MHKRLLNCPKTTIFHPITPECYNCSEVIVLKKTLWTRNFSLLIIATILGSIGSIAGGFALSFLVFDETGSTLASALVLAIQLFPGFVIPLMAAPLMDRLPRKPFLVGGDAVNGFMYLFGGLYLLFCPFSFIGYLMFSLVLASLQSFDSLAYMSIFPKLITEGMEEKGYALSSMLYPILQVVMMPLAAVLLDTFGVALIIIAQGILSILAAIIESFIRIQEDNRLAGDKFSWKMWVNDIREAADYLRNEPGLRGIFNYMAVTNGVANGYGPLLVAYFRITIGLTTAMYSLFSVVEFLGRTLGGLVCYNIKIPKNRRFAFAFSVYQIYELMDVTLLWLPYPAMLVNRGVCGFLGINSATMRQAAVQQYIPESLRARLNAYQSILTLAAGTLLTLIIGLAGEIMDHRICMSACGIFTCLVCWITVWRNRNSVKRIYESQRE